MNEEKCVMCFPPQYMNFVHSFEASFVCSLEYRLAMETLMSARRQTGRRTKLRSAWYAVRE